MKTIKTLTVGGETYSLSHLDDTKVGDGGWSAKKLIDTLCPAFTATGKEVSCYPVEGYPLETVSTILPYQETAPSFDAPIPLQGKEILSLDHNGERVTAALGQTVYGGTYNWKSGELTLTYGIYTMTGGEEFSRYDKFFLAYNPGFFRNSVANEGLCSHGSYASYKTGCWCVNGAAIYAPNGDYAIDESGLQAFRAAVTAQYENGTPVQLCYKLATPVTVQVDPKEMFAKAGENVFSSDEELTIRGRWDLKKLLEGVV